MYMFEKSSLTIYHFVMPLPIPAGTTPTHSQQPTSLLAPLATARNPSAEGGEGGEPDPSCLWDWA